MQRIKKILAPLASLRLTVILLAAAMLLIFAGTTVQSEMSIWDVQHRYFHSWITFLEWRLFVPLWGWGNKNIPGAIPFPGGYTIIVLLLVNLISAHWLRFKISWKRSGILLIHGGLILLLVGEIVTSQLAVESQMILNVGGGANFVEDTRAVELAVIDPSPSDHDDVTVIPAGQLIVGNTVQHPSLPFAIHVDSYFNNSQILGPMQNAGGATALATAGAGRGLRVISIPKATGTDAQKTDVPSAYISLLAGDQNLGTYLVSMFFDQPQSVDVNGKTYHIELRPKRIYEPYTVQLLKFSHDRYLGTDVAKNFSSRIRLIDPSKNVDREVLVWMNHPLRYAGETFYQASFLPGDQTSILQVVRNPGWLIPYISCSMVGLGLLVHFGMHLLQFLGRNTREKAKTKIDLGSWKPAAIAVGILAIYLISLANPTHMESSDFDLQTFARLPVSYEGRMMPLDSLARNSLRIISGKSAVPDANQPAISWLLDIFSHPDKAGSAKIFRVDHPDVLSLLKLDANRKYFSIAEIDNQLPALQDQYKLAAQVESKQRDLYQRKIVELGDHIKLFNTLGGLDSLYLSPPLTDDQWRTFADAMKGVDDKSRRDAGAESILAMIQAAFANQSAGFNQIVSEYSKLLAAKLPDVIRKMRLEVIFNRVEPFVQCMAMYVIVFILAAISWGKWHKPLARAALWVLVLTLAVHTLALVARVYLQGHPPVTNLYSSAIFIAWAAVLFCVGLELIYRNSVACAAAAAIAFPSLLIAHNLAGDGDTMRMLQAVLDTNIWLATHVVVITLGYTATFLAGTLAIGYVLAGVFTRALNPDTRKSLMRMVYGVVCFAMLFSFVGTILGGIWADQSWGRFWGWDPKENGAVLIVLWNAIVLHARWGGLVRERGFMLLAIFGNAVTSWSWFGTNMLGIGLHSYGFMDSAVTWLGIWVAIQAAVIAIGAIPLHAWRSYSARETLPKVSVAPNF